MELTAEGELIVMPPAGTESSDRNSEINMQLRIWAKRNGTGTTFDSLAGFTLPNGAVRSPDTSWVERTRLDALTAEQLEKFAPLCPDFVIELRSSTDRINRLKAKMEEYMANGAELGWLIDPEERSVWIYRPGRAAECVVNPERISGEGPVAGLQPTSGGYKSVLEVRY